MKIVHSLFVALSVTLAVKDTKYTAPQLPPTWRFAEVDQNELVPVTFSLKQGGAEKMQRLVADVSDPSSPSYGKYLSPAEVRALTAPLEAAVSLVEGWLNKVDVPFTRENEVVVAQFTAGSLESVLNTQLYRASNDETQQNILQAGDYYLPMEVQDSIDAMYGLHGLPLPPRKTLQGPEPPRVTPAVIAETYDMGGVTPSGMLENRQAVVEFGGQTMLPKDLKLFFKSWVENYTDGDDKIYAFRGQGKPVGYGAIEASLDIDVIMGVAPGIKTEFWYFEGGSSFCEVLKAWTHRMVMTDDLPLVFSVSYGWQGDLEYVGCAEDQISDIENDFTKLAARGISIIISSGDSGSGFEDPDCYDEKQQAMNMGVKGTLAWSYKAQSVPYCCYYSQAIGIQAWSYSKDGTCSYYSSVTGNYTEEGTIVGGDLVVARDIKLHASWPSTSPFVTSIGATRFIKQKIGNKEMATDQFGSGGGFSPRFNQMASQLKAVQAYLSTVEDLPPASTYRSDGRATPDISALGEGYVIVANGQNIEGVGGTSASAPAIAAMVSLLNEARLSAGMPAMGLLNPWLYANPDMFKDVIRGTGAIYRSGGMAPMGFPCAPGWDPVTGLGTPIFSKMLTSALGNCTAPACNTAKQA